MAHGFVAVPHTSASFIKHAPGRCWVFNSPHVSQRGLVYSARSEGSMIHVSESRRLSDVADFLAKHGALNG